MARCDLVEHVLEDGHGDALALALGQIRGRTTATLLTRELMTGLGLGLTLAAIGFLFVFAVVPDAGTGLAWTLSISIFLSIIPSSCCWQGLACGSVRRSVCNGKT